MGVGQLRGMRVFVLVEQRQQLDGTTLESGFLHHFTHHGARGRVAYVTPTSRQGPEPVAALLHQQDIAVIVLNKRPHIQLGGGIAFIQGDPRGDGIRFQVALTGNEGSSSRPERLEAGDVEGILGVGEPGLSRGQHLFQKGGQRRLHG
ncbi:hypothetical protein D3C77_423890 [compost metagenome]